MRSFKRSDIVNLRHSNKTQTMNNRHHHLLYVKLYINVMYYYLIIIIIIHWFVNYCFEALNLHFGRGHLGFLEPEVTIVGREGGAEQTLS